jgi:tetratricopeptide (TPR) repeat protein
VRTPETNLQTNDVLSAGILYARAKETTRARQVLRRLADYQKSIPSSWNRSSFHNLEGEILLADKRLNQAEAAFQAAVADYPQALSHTGLAHIYEAQQRWQLASPEWERVLHARGEILQNGFPPDLVFAHLELGRGYRKLGDRERARNHYDEVLRLWEHADDLPSLREARREAQELTLERKPQTEGTLVIPPQFK